MKDKFCVRVTESLLCFEETPVNKSSSIIPFIPAGKENIFNYLQLETTEGGLIHCSYSELRLKCCLIAAGFF